MIRAYGVYREDFVCDMHGVAQLGTFIVGSNGTIQYREVLESRKPARLRSCKTGFETIH